MNQSDEPSYEVPATTYATTDDTAARRSAFRRGLAVGGLAGAVLGIVGVTLAGAFVSWSPGGIVTYGPDAGPATTGAVVGDCLDATPDEHGDYAVVDCLVPHDLEVAAVIGAPLPEAARHPGVEALDWFGAAACELAFAHHVGVPWEESALDYRAVSPDAASWDAGGRDVYCLVRTMDGAPLTGSVRGTHR